MKRILLVIIILVYLQAIGCNNIKKYDVNVNYEVNEYHGGGIGRKDNSNNPQNFKPIFDELETNQCYLFNGYDDLEKFLNDYELFLSDDMAHKYNRLFFNDKALIIYFGCDSSGGYKYNFYLFTEGKVLNLIADKSRNKNSDHTTVEVDRIFFIDINKNDILDTNEFKFSIELND